MPATAPPAPARSAGRTVTAAAIRQARRGTAIVAGFSGGMTALVAVQYRGLDGALGAESLTALAENPAIRTLFGPPVGLDTAGGFTVWRTGTVLAVLVGIWAALTATRLTRGEEEAGRFDLLLAGRLRLRSLVARVLLVLLAASLVVGVAGGLDLLLAGAPAAGSVLFGAGLAGTGMVGAALGVLAAQLFADRRSASGLAVAVLLAGLLARMVSDGVPALAWLAWGTPFGLLGRAAPFAADRVLPLLVLAVLVAAVAAAAVALAAGRDVGRGRLAGRDRRARPSRLLTSLPGLAVHRTRRPLAGWAAGAAAYFLLIGLLADDDDRLPAGQPRLRRSRRPGRLRAARVGGRLRVGAVHPARRGARCVRRQPGRRHRGRRDRRAADPAVLPAGRPRPLGRHGGRGDRRRRGGPRRRGGSGRLGRSGLGGCRPRPGQALAGALAVLPVGLLCLGAALAALGWAPAAVLAIGVTPAVGGYLLLVFADTFGWPDAVRWFSPFAHLNAVPAEPWNAAGAAGMLAVAALLALAGCLRYAHRDLAG